MLWALLYLMWVSTVKNWQVFGVDTAWWRTASCHFRWAVLGVRMSLVTGWFFWFLVFFFPLLMCLIVLDRLPVTKDLITEKKHVLSLLSQSPSSNDKCHTTSCGWLSLLSDSPVGSREAAVRFYRSCPFFRLSKCCSSSCPVGLLSQLSWWSYADVFPVCGDTHARSADQTWAWMC